MEKLISVDLRLLKDNFYKKQKESVDMKFRMVLYLSNYEYFIYRPLFIFLYDIWKAEPFFKGALPTLRPSQSQGLAGWYYNHIKKNIP